MWPAQPQPRWIILDAIDDLPAKVRRFRNRDDIGVLAQHVLNHGELLAVVARLASTVVLAIGLCVLNASPLGFLVASHETPRVRSRVQAGF